MNISIATELTEEIYDAFQALIPQLSKLAPPTKEMLDELISAEATMLLLARDDGADEKIVGVLTLICFRVPTGVRAIIEDVVVDAHARGLGAATKLLHAAFRIAQDKGANGIMLTSNPRREAANRLYQKIGFKRWQTNLYFYEF